MKKISVLFFVMALALSVFAQDRVPSIVLTRLNGEKVNIAEHVKQNEITIINFWATWCAPCRRELENIVELYPEWRENYNVEIIAVSIDDARTRAKVKPYVDGQGFTYNVLMDENKELFQALNGIMPPLTLIINKEGVILDIKTGYSPGDEDLLEEKLKKYTAKK